MVHGYQVHQSHRKNTVEKRATMTAYPYRPSNHLKELFKAAVAAYHGSTNDFIEECVQRQMTQTMESSHEKQAANWKHYESLRNMASSSERSLANSRDEIDTTEAARIAAADKDLRAKMKNVIEAAEYDAEMIRRSIREADEAKRVAKGADLVKKDVKPPRPNPPKSSSTPGK